MVFYRAILFIFLINWCFTIRSQEEGQLQFIGINMYNDKPLSFSKIQVKNNGKIIAEINTKETNRFKTQLPLGSVYDVYLLNGKTQPMFLRVFADIPENKRNIRTTYELEIPFFPKDASTIDTTQFINPFHQIVFDGKNKFVDDTVYMNAFLRKVYKTKQETEVIKPVTKVKQYVQLAGKLNFVNDKKTPLKHKLISLVDKNGEVIASTLTTHHGIFAFPGIDPEVAAGLVVTLSDSENPNHDKVNLMNSSLENVDLASVNPVNHIYGFHKTGANDVIKKLIDPEFRFNAGGKLITVKNNEKTVAANKMVYLLGSKDNVVQKVKTNSLGNFLFTRIIPNQDYSFSFDTSEFALDEHLNLYSVRDKFIKKIDSTSKSKFIYKFISTSKSDFNDLIVDDSELKMNVKGRLYGDNKNNPLSNIKVMLLNEKFDVIDSTITNEKGDFLFSYLAYAKQFMISVDNEKSLLESFNNILVFDNDDNLIKIVAVAKGKKFNYKPLNTELSALSDIYVDDPWLAVINPKLKTGKEDKNTSETIIENILFEFNKSELLSQSKQTLDKVVLAMTANQKVEIELSAHSDSKGPDAYNLKLSEERAKSARDYIVSKGIDPIRIAAKGYGETRLLNNCGNNVKCSDDEHAVNRRLEFKLIYK